MSRSWLWRRSSACGAAPDPVAAAGRRLVRRSAPRHGRGCLVHGLRAGCRARAVRPAVRFFLRSARHPQLPGAGQLLHHWRRASRRVFVRHCLRIRGWLSCQSEVGSGLQTVVCFRYRLPNFPHSSACDSRACQRLGAFLTDGGENPLCVRLIEFVHLRGDHQVSPAVRLEPSLQFQIVGHPAPAGIQNEKRGLKCRPC